MAWGSGGGVENAKWPDYKGRLRVLGGGWIIVNRARVKDSVKSMLTIFSTP
jgi:hypothetical protein